MGWDRAVELTENSVHFEMYDVIAFSHNLSVCPTGCINLSAW